MTREDKGHFAEKHEKDQSIDPRILEAIRDRTVENEIPCAVAFTIVGDLGISPEDVGRAVDLVEKKITKCQLGLFGYGPGKQAVKPAEELDPDLEKAIRGSLAEGRLPCKAAWDIAERLELRKMQVSSACETLGFKINKCQLGTFR
ncbi:MAG: hypothetical protein RQ767_07455 [Thermovirgaceae bacterium]|nr:hypothetical protein [Thermovirgaceae bacterium]